MQSDYAVEMINISKRFGGIQALEEVSLRVRKGEVHALVGENGAGKSTLMKILSGAYAKDEGEIFINGEKKHIANSQEARKAGIGIIYQEFALAPDLTVAENIFLGEELSLKNPIVHKKNMNNKAAKLLESINFHIDPSCRVDELSVAYQQMTEIAKALNQDANVLILDEPTAVLGPSEAEKLFEVVEDLKKKGVSIIYISHRMDEIFRISDSISVLKDGRMVDTLPCDKTTVDDLITKMIGRDMGDMFPERDKNHMPGEVVLEVKNLKQGNIVNDVSFDVRKGEIVGIAGLVGAGKTECMRIIFGADRKSEGRVLILGDEKRITSPQKAVKSGIGYVPENRKEHGVLLDMSVRVNTTLANVAEYTGVFGGLKKANEIAKTQEMIEKLAIKTDGTETPVGNLSGGNQQKVSLAKWVSLENKVIILDEPTRGVDVGAKAEIYKIIQNLAYEGMGIIFISSEMMEVIGMSDRVLVMHEGHISGELSRGELSEENIMRLAVGQLN